MLDTILDPKVLADHRMRLPDDEPDRAAWALFPWVMMQVYAPQKGLVSYDKVASIRPDGGTYFSHLVVAQRFDGLTDMDSLLDTWFGPAWNGDQRITLAEVRHQWGPEIYRTELYQSRVTALLDPLAGLLSGNLVDEYTSASLIREGYAVRRGEETVVALPVIDDWSLIDELTDTVRFRLTSSRATVDRRAREVKKLLLDQTPEHVRHIRRFELEHLLGSNGMFLATAMSHLVSIGRLAVHDERSRNASCLLIDHRDAD